jgi:hypothetical protein
MKDWNDKKIATAQSKGGVLVVADPLENVISTGCSPWPAMEIVQKLYESRQVRAFNDEQRAICTSGLGYYCDLQSLHSEDVITWSVFGTVARSDRPVREAWASEFLRLIGLDGTVSPASVPSVPMMLRHLPPGKLM